MLYDVYRMRLQGVMLSRQQAFERGSVRGELWLYPTAHKGKITELARVQDTAFKDLIQYLRGARVREVDGKPGVLAITGEEFQDPAPAKAGWQTWLQEWRCVPVPPGEQQNQKAR